MQGFVSQLIETHHESIFQSRWRCEWYASDARTSQPSRVQRGRTADSRYDRVQGGRIFPARCPRRHRENRRVPETHCARWRRHPRCRSPCASTTLTRYLQSQRLPNGRPNRSSQRRLQCRLGRGYRQSSFIRLRTSARPGMLRTHVAGAFPANAVCELSVEQRARP